MAADVTVAWSGCNVCEKWFHNACLGADHAQPGYEWLCETCRAATHEEDLDMEVLPPDE